MVKFVIKAGTFKTIIELMRAEGRNHKGVKMAMFDDCMLEVSKDGAVINAIDENEVLITQIQIELAEVSSKNTGNIPLDLKTTLATLKRFKPKDEITIKYSDGFVTFTRSKPKLSYRDPALPEDAVKSEVEKEIPFVFNGDNNTWSAAHSDGKKTVKFNTYISVKAEEFKEVIADGEQIQYRSFPFVVTKTKATVIIEDTESGKRSEREIQTDEIKTTKTVSSIFSYGFGNAFANLKGDIEIWMASGAPIIIQKIGEGYELTYILAQVILEEWEDESDEEDYEGGEGDDEDIEDMEKGLEDALKDVDLFEEESAEED